MWGCEDRLFLFPVHTGDLSFSLSKFSAQDGKSQFSKILVFQLSLGSSGLTAAVLLFSRDALQIKESKKWCDPVMSVNDGTVLIKLFITKLLGCLNRLTYHNKHF